MLQNHHCQLFLENYLLISFSLSSHSPSLRHSMPCAKFKLCILSICPQNWNFACSNEPCADEPNVTAGCSHTGSRIRAKMHTANAATTNKHKLVSVGMAKHLLTLTFYNSVHFFRPIPNIFAIIHNINNPIF